MKMGILALLKDYGKRGDLDKGTRLHTDILKEGLLVKDPHIASALVSMYAKCGALAKAQQVLDELPVRDLFSWSALITGYAQHGKGKEALTCFERMQGEGFSPDAVTFSSVLKACGSINAVHMGKQIHDEIVSQGLLGENVVLGTALVDMYARCGATMKAQRVLDELTVRDVITWNALIAAYVQRGQGEEALDCFERLQAEGLSPNEVTYICIFKACGTIGSIDKGIQVHDEIINQGLLHRNILVGTALVDMYAKCGMLERAHEVLDGLPDQDIVSWCALIEGYSGKDQSEEALKCFERMQQEGFSPDVVSFICILKVCGSTGAVDKGKQVHAEIVKQGLLGEDVVIGTALVDMYAKCGTLSEAEDVLEKLSCRDATTWNALMSGYAQQFQGEEALNCLEGMLQDGLCPSAITFTCVLNACSRLGLIDKCQTSLTNMNKEYGILPDIEHNTCMVDLFCRAGDFDRAIAVIKTMAPSENHAAWSVLLDACKKWGNVKLGRWVFECAVQMGRNDPRDYVCMANIYMAAGLCDDAETF